MYLFIYLVLFYWLCWIFISVRGLSLVAASGGHSSSRCVGLSPSWPLLLWSTGSRRAGSVIVAHGPSCSAACGIFPNQGSNPCPLHWQADSQPLCHQGSPPHVTFWPTYNTPVQGTVSNSYISSLALVWTVVNLGRIPWKGCSPLPKRKDSETRPLIFPGNKGPLDPLHSDLTRFSREDQ